MTTQKIKNYLDEKGIEYTVSRHSNAYTAQEVASKAHISGKEFAKTVIITMSNRLVMCVLPASYRVDFNLLKEALGTNDISLATETEFKFIFPDCEIGAMPPFGNLYDMDVYVAESLTNNEKIAFNAGTHTETIKMNYSDFKNLVNPRIIKFSKKEFTFPGDPSERWSHDY
ncbi:MAG TPA: YbaK/EbsC family protein [Mariniphaga sp.]|nr:YbaK/EbsC family protein [Mariniphaga sp.]